MLPDHLKIQSIPLSREKHRLQNRLNPPPHVISKYYQVFLSKSEESRATKLIVVDAHQFAARNDQHHGRSARVQKQSKGEPST